MSVFDREAALVNVGGDADLLAELFVIFEEEYPQLVEAIRAGIAAGESDQVQNAAHSIKGAISPFAAQRAHEAASRLEQSAAAAELLAASEGLAQLEEEIARLCHDLRHDLRQMLRIDSE